MSYKRTGIYKKGDVTKAFAKDAKVTKPLYESGDLQIVASEVFSDNTCGGIIGFQGMTRKEADIKILWHILYKGETVVRKLPMPRDVHSIVFGLHAGLEIERKRARLASENGL